MNAPETGSEFRASNRMLGVPKAMVLSHGRTQSELLAETERPGKSALHRARDYLRIRVVFWVWHYLKSRFGGRHEFLDYVGQEDDKGVYYLAASQDRSDAGPVAVSLIGDWASGTKDAANVAAKVEEGAPHFTIHLGDVYYVGTKKEILENMLGGKVTWPIGSRGSFALNANHEMYARGKAYFKHLLPRMGMRPTSDAVMAGQKASFFCLQNEHWLVIGLDTGYYSVGLPVLEKIFKPSCKLHSKLLDWLRDDVRLHEDRERGIILLSHHQYYSQFERHHDRAARQLSELLGRPVLWFWGHEHRLAIYGKHSTKEDRAIEAYGRCLGHGGLPIEDIDQVPKSAKKDEVGLVVYDRRERTSVGRRRTAVGFNGFANLIFQGNRLTVQYWDTADLLLREKWEVVDGGILRGVSIEQLSNDEDIVVHAGRLEAALE